MTYPIKILKAEADKIKAEIERLKALSETDDMNTVIMIIEDDIQNLQLNLDQLITAINKLLK